MKTPSWWTARLLFRGVVGGFKEFVVSALRCEGCKVKHFKLISMAVSISISCIKLGGGGQYKIFYLY